MEDQNQTQTPSQATAPQAADETLRSQQPGADAPAGDEVARLTQQVAELEAKAKENYELFMRAVAEGENIRRRAQEEVSKAHKFAIENFADNLVPVMDSLQAALADNTGDLKKLREGVELTARQLAAAFERGKIVEVNPVGEKFDPHRHQAISMVPSEQDPNTVVSVLQRGYTIADRVLRPALVTVSAPR